MPILPTRFLRFAAHEFPVALRAPYNSCAQFPRVPVHFYGLGSILVFFMSVGRGPGYRFGARLFITTLAITLFQSSDKSC